MTGHFEENTEKITESILYCLQTAVKDNERNHRKLLIVGLDILMDIEERVVPKGLETTENVKRTLKSEAIQGMAKFLVELIGEFNYIVCRHCDKKQSIKGLNCLYCGCRLPIESDSLGILSPERRKKIIAEAGNYSILHFITMIIYYDVSFFILVCVA